MSTSYTKAVTAYKAVAKAQPRDPASSSSYAQTARGR